jgi:hypothetical protein
VLTCLVGFHSGVADGISLSRNIQAQKGCGFSEGQPLGREGPCDHWGRGAGGVLGMAGRHGRLALPGVATEGFEPPTKGL